MNPYTYQKKGKASEPETQSLLKVCLSAFSVPMSSAVAFAMILLAGGTLMSMTSYAYTELASNGDDYVAIHNVRPQASVLGDSTTAPSAVTIDDSSLEAGTAMPLVKLSAKPISFDSGVARWNYVIAYASPSLAGTGSITIGTYVVSGSLTATTGKVETGAILKPGMVYHVNFSVGGQTEASIDLKTPKGNSSGNDFALVSPCPVQGQGTSTPPSVHPGGPNATSTAPGAMFCLKTKDGKMICPRPPVCGPLMGDKKPGDGHNTTTPPKMDYSPSPNQSSGP